MGDREGGGQVLDLTADERQLFVATVRTLYAEARQKYDRNLLALVGV